jgi:hypothetical protein
VNSGIGDEVGLEFSDIDIKSTIKSQGSGEGGNNLSDKSV